MDIHNVTEFRNFVNANKLNSLSPEIAAVANCVTDYERGCNCWKAGDKQKIYNNCKILYVRAIGVIITGFASQFAERSFDKTVKFSQDGMAIGSVSR